MTIALTRVSEDAFFARDTPVAITAEDIDMLKREVGKTSRKRIRICTHPDVNAALHEMFVCYTREAVITPHKHLGKDETFYVIEGELDFVFFNDDGTERAILPMGDKESGRAFCLRVPMNTFHTARLRSDCVVHEATPGPFRIEDTVWA